MPKIIFRPNPTPPPYVPPQPVLATKVDIYVNPIPFMIEDVVQMKLSKDGPITFVELNLQIRQDSSSDWSLLKAIVSSEVTWDEVFNTSIESDYIANAEYRAIFYDESGEEFIIPAYMHTLT